MAIRLCTLIELQGHSRLQAALMPASSRTTEISCHMTVRALEPGTEWAQWVLYSHQASRIVGPWVLDAKIPAGMRLPREHRYSQCTTLGVRIFRFV